MTTIKSYSDLQQSKKLAEILPLESADMCYYEYTSHIDGTPKVGYKEGITEGIPCWSLAALMDVLDCGALFKTPQGWACQTYIGSKTETTNYYNNPLDACYEMILMLHERKML